MTLLPHETSCQCTKSELDFFSLPPIQTVIEEGQWTEYYPLSSVTNRGPIEFCISGLRDEYLDSVQSYLHVKAKIVKLDGTNKRKDEDTSAPVNLLLHSLFSQVDVYLIDKLISSSHNLYAYKAYIETLLIYNGEAKRSHLTSSIWKKDTASKFDDLDFNDGKNNGINN
ncbi:uncharacterized protein LOC106462055 [Limulus polyphemus]|uniref:Uncharacterized protein LOC106462055 n=1 Tax=Limulus polyphemus TaxID=6850 RepID=A0ABM1B981_LIMPO|nr:uncharacterized protein LOC106462055 [Limulus polyphemus]